MRLKKPAEAGLEACNPDLSGFEKGKQTMPIGQQWIRINTSAVEPGMYLLRVPNGPNLIHKKVIIKHEN
ncbi:MAG: T9SS type A sorting domain-containing protein [Cyclobacteriaceae bacterium]|nr:T9SS type A sorting domain-containing protein [Cyclobacteriaceae bacterium]